MSTTAQRRPRSVHYPETDHMGEHEMQRFIAELLRPLIERWLTSKRVLAHVGADTFFYWVEGDPTQRIAPDVYVLSGVEQSIEAPSWRMWEIGKGSLSLGFEIVTSNWSKDYDDVPVSYAALDAKELVIFDAGAKSTHRLRFRWQVYRHIRGRGLVRVEVSQGDRVKSKSLGCWLRAVEVPGGVRIRLAQGQDGETLFPTEAEAQSARADLEAARATEAAARADAEYARAEASAAEAARLRTELDVLRRR